LIVAIKKSGKRKIAVQRDPNAGSFPGSSSFEVFICLLIFLQGEGRMKSKKIVVAPGLAKDTGFYFSQTNGLPFNGCVDRFFLLFHKTTPSCEPA